MAFVIPRRRPRPPLRLGPASDAIPGTDAVANADVVADVLSSPLAEPPLGVAVAVNGGVSKLVPDAAADACRDWRPSPSPSPSPNPRPSTGSAAGRYESSERRDQSRCDVDYLPAGDPARGEMGVGGKVGLKSALSVVARVPDGEWLMRMGASTRSS